MALPTSSIWNIADFNESTIGSLLSLGPSDLTITPGVVPYFSYNDDFTILTSDSRDSVEAKLDFHVAIPARFTIEFEARFPFMPNNLGDLAHRRVGFTVADDAGRGISIYFATSGVAVSRVDDLGSVSALPDTTETTEEINTQFRTIRVAVDSALGRAYVFISSGETTGLELRYILPVEQTPPSVIDTFRLFAKGLATEPSSLELRTLRLAADLVIPNYPPVANAGPDRVAPVGSSVRFDGRASYDLEGAALTYQWQAIDAPTGSQYNAENGSGMTVDNGDADGVTDTLSFPPNALPAWISPGDVLLIASVRGIVATFNNPGGVLTVTTDVIPDNLHGSPFRVIRQSILVGANTETPYIVPDVQGLYRFQLVVNDGEISSEPAEVLANIVGARAPFGVEPDLSPMWKALGDEWRFIEGRGVFEEVWRGVAQIFAGKLLEAWQYHYNYSIRDAQRTFQKKWVAYRTLITETSPDTVTIKPRYGLIRSNFMFETAAPSVIGQTIVVEYFTGGTPTELATATITLTGNTLAQIVTDLNSGLAGTGIIAYPFAVRQDNPLVKYDGTGGSTVDDGDGDGVTVLFSFPPASLPSWVSPGDTLCVGGVRATIATVNNGLGQITATAEIIPDNLSGATFRIYRMCRLGLRSTARAFRISPSSTAAAGLQVATGVYSYLSGATGAFVTTRSYYAGDGVNLSEHGVSRADLLALNNGQSFRVDRINSDPLDPLPGQRVVLLDELPFDASETWEISSVVASTEVDYENLGAYPGDLVKAEVFDSTNNAVTDVLGHVVAQKGTQLAVRLDGLFGAVLNTTRYEIRLLGVKRRKGIPIDENIISVPQLQDQIPLEAKNADGDVVSVPTYWKEQRDYYLEPFYRDVGGAAIPTLQFRDSVFIDPDLEPPDIFWAELTIFSNDPNVEDLFGRLVGFLKDDASKLPSDFNYVAGVGGLMYAQQRGPNVYSVRVGAQVLFGQSFAEVAGVIEEIRFDYSPLQGRMLIRDQDGNTPTQSEIVRTYYYKKDPLDLSDTSGLAINPVTNLPWAVGDNIDQFRPIGAGVDIVDLYNTPNWYIPYVKSGLITEIEKFHYFLVRFNLDLVSLSNLVLIYQFVNNVKPTYTHPLLVGLRQHEEDLDVLDEVDMNLVMHEFDSTCGMGRAFMYDDYRGDGTIWSSFDDGSTYFDGIVDCPLDIIQFCMEITWAGGIITYDSIFFLDTLVIDVSGTMGPPGGTFTPTYDMNLPAGIYRVCVYIKSGGVVLP
jgi:hypothetical protein